MPTHYSGRILTIVAVILVALLVLFPPTTLLRSDMSLRQKLNLKPGIDMQGGTSLLYDIKPPEGSDTSKSAVTYQGGLANDVMQALKKRIDPDGVKNLIWRPHGDTRLEIQMPATEESRQAEELGKQLNSVREQLEKTNVTTGEVIAAVEQSPDAATRDKRLAEMADGSKARQDIFKELTTAWDKLQAAKKANDAEAAADAQQAYVAAQAKIDSTNLRPDQLEAVLDLGATKPAERQKALPALEQEKAANFPARKAALDQYIKTYDAYTKVREQSAGVADLKRKLRGAGVLEFHILAVDAPSDMVQEMQQRLAKEGPHSKAGDKLKWFEVNDTEKDKISGPTGQYNGKTYALAWITADKSMDHREGVPNWGLRGSHRTTGQLGETLVAFEFDPMGGQLFGELSGNNLHKPLAIILDQKIISAPNLNARITDSGVIEGRFTDAEISYLVDTLNAGSLKAQLADEPISERTIGPQLGADNLRRGLMSCVIGAIAVTVFMVCYYYFAGLVASVALMLNVLLILATMAALNATFTLPGVAAVVLTLGMAVDANVLIYERLREEKARGLSINMALRNAYDRAKHAIYDGNLTTAITSLALYLFGSEEVKGFGLTLIIGIAWSLFTALFVTKTIFGLMLRAGLIKDLRSLPETFPRWQRALHPNINWMGKAWMFYAFSTIFIIIGLTCFGLRASQGKILDVEFSKGTSVEFDLTHPMDQQAVRDLVEAESHKNPQGLPSPQVVSTGTENKSYEVITPNEKAPVVRQAIMEALGDKLAVERPSDFRNVGVNLEQALSSGAIVPITSASQQIAGFVPTRLPAHVGGAAIVLQDLKPALPPDKVKQRIEEQRLQAQTAAEGAGYRAFDVEQAPAKGPNGENTVVILVSDQSFPYDASDPLKLQQWKDTVAAPMWRVANDAINKPAELQKVTNFDAQVAGDTTRDALIALTLSILGIMAYIWVRFGDLKYGLATVVALLHDVLLTIAAVGMSHYLTEVAFFQKYLLIEPFRLNLTLVAAILTVMGYSMNDTVVVFDRIRENRGRLGKASKTVINDSINQTLSRTLITSGLTFMTVTIMYFFGGSGIHGFTFALMIGIIVGTYSSIAIASPILLLGQGREAGGSDGRSKQAGAVKADRAVGKLEGVGAR